MSDMAVCSDDYFRYPFFDCIITEDVKIKFRSQFFYPNICYLCSARNNEFDVSRMRRCEDCNMITYCGKLHQMDHWPEHKDLCAEIVRLLKSSTSNNLFDFLRTMEDPEKRLKKKQNLIEAVQRRLKRKFKKFETQMFLHPRVCVVCLESNPQKLENCLFCPQISFCENHINVREHDCQYFRICYLLDWKSVIGTRFEISPAIEKFPIIYNAEDVKLPENMAQFLTENIQEMIPMLETLNGAKLWPHVCSELYTNSLTLMNVLKELKFEFESELTVHVIGVQTRGEKDFEDLEMLLHLIPQLMTLKVTVIGKVIGQNTKETKPEVSVCRECAVRNKTLIIERTELTYTTYAESKSFRTPHVVIAYNFEENEVRLWSESVKKMMKIRASFIMTTSTKSRAQTQHKKMSELFGNLASKSYFKKNAFVADRPYRDPQEDGLKFSNNYIAVYTLFEEKIEKQTKKKKRRGQSEIELPDFVIEEERELRRQKSLAYKNGAVKVSTELKDESEKTDNSNYSLNSGENIQKTTGSNHYKKNVGEDNSKKMKKKQKKTAKHASESCTENSLLKLDVPKALNSSKGEVELFVNATMMSKVLLDEQIVDPHSQNQEVMTSSKGNEKVGNDLKDKVEFGAKVPSSGGKTEKTSGKSRIDESLSDSTNNKDKLELGAGETPAKSEDRSIENQNPPVEASKYDEKIQDCGEFKSLIPEENNSNSSKSSVADKESRTEILEVDEKTEDNSNPKSLEQPLDLANKSKEAESSEQGGEAGNQRKLKLGKKKNEEVRNEESAESIIKEENPIVNQDKPSEQEETLNFQENADLEAQIQSLTAQITCLKRNCKTMARGFLTEISVLKKCLQSLEDRVKEAADVHD